MELAGVFYLLLGFAIFMYVWLDGFDLGLGILYPWFRDDQERDHMMRAVAPVWDGNETWLVFGGVILFAAFPTVYAVALSTLYLPVMLMLIALVFRGVAFEYRFKAKTSRPWWDLAFAAGSTVAAFCQGLMLGAVVQGVEGHAQGSSLNWLSPFAIFCGFALMAGYALLACTFLVMKTRHALAARAATLGQGLVWWVLGALVVVSLWSVWHSPAVWSRWFEGGRFLWLWPLPVLCALVAWRLNRALRTGTSEYRPFALAVALFALGFVGLLVSTFPYLVPGQIRYMDVAAPDISLRFVGVGVLMFLPVILAYTLWGYKVFHGKVEDMEAGY